MLWLLFEDCCKEAGWHWQHLATIPWKRKPLAFLGLSLKQSSPLWIPNTWTSWGTKRDRTSRAQKPSFLRVYGLPGASAGFPTKQAFRCRHLSVCTERCVAPRSVAQPEAGIQIWWIFCFKETEWTEKLKLSLNMWILRRLVVTSDLEDQIESLLENW